MWKAHQQYHSWVGLRAFLLMSVSDTASHNSQSQQPFQALLIKNVKEHKKSGYNDVIFKGGKYRGFSFWMAGTPKWKLGHKEETQQKLHFI